MKKYYSINEIASWFNLNSNHIVSSELIIYLISNNILSQEDKGLYSLEKVKELLLVKEFGQYKVIGNKFVVKECRKAFIESFGEKIEKAKYKITALNGKKLKLIKLG